MSDFVKQELSCDVVALEVVVSELNDDGRVSVAVSQDDAVVELVVAFHDQRLKSVVVVA